jgi:hypothetical protein
MADEHERQRQKNHRKVVRQQAELAELADSSKNANLESIWTAYCRSCVPGEGCGLAILDAAGVHEPTGGIGSGSTKTFELIVSIQFESSGGWTRCAAATDSFRHTRAAAPLSTRRHPLPSHTQHTRAAAADEYAPPPARTGSRPRTRPLLAASPSPTAR